MRHFRAELVAGGKAPYTSWTFLVIPAAIQKDWKNARFEVEGTLNGEAFRGRAAKGEGVHRIPLKKELLDRLGLSRGDVVEVAIRIPKGASLPEIPEELLALFEEDADLAASFGELAPSLQRAWTSYVAEAKRPETRLRRASQAPSGIRARKFPDQK